MLTFRAGAAGSIGAARKMADHLITQTLPATAQALATYYQRGITAGATEGQDHAQVTDAQMPGMAPEPRRDMDAVLATLLGLDLSRPPTRDEIASLLAGLRADGEKIAGKQYQKATLPLSEIFGFDPMRLATREELANVLAGRRPPGGRQRAWPRCCGTGPRSIREGTRGRERQCAHRGRAGQHIGWPHGER